MTRSRQYDAAEQELIQAEHAILEEEARRGSVDGCPTDAVLQQFAAGRVDREQAREEILAHLSACDRCVQFMGELRRQKMADFGSRRAHIRKSALAALATVIILAVSIWIWNRTHRELQISNRVATVDLRLMSPMRGGDPAPAAAAAKVPRLAGQLRLILPVGSDGTYEAGLFRTPAQGSSFLQDSGHTRLENHDVVLVLKLKLARVQPGGYWLGLRQEHSIWVFFPVLVD